MLISIIKTCLYHLLIPKLMSFINKLHIGFTKYTQKTQLLPSKNPYLSIFSFHISTHLTGINNYRLKIKVGKHK